MARNCEKKFVGLNRIFLEKQRKEELERNPKRPSLYKLHSASEVKKWIPSIKREMDYNLQQLSGARQHKYPDHKIQEFQENVERLEKEYKSFVKKVFELDPSTTGIPWQPRGYVSKRKQTGSPNPVVPKKICTPILDNENMHEGMAELDCQSHSELDQHVKIDKQETALSIKRPMQTTETAEATTTATAAISTTSKSQTEKDFKKNAGMRQELGNSSILGLDYSSSDDD
ncbi:uncharacterized protein LOC116297117 [Actinia tenebrosa]|uniref:Uncharacterized protein LOC116297117 n=1 Tax=Actinia tenebrosa TaxID=6105 RepID=A0A6P8HXP0_ACTTE|nr:uncharacterized protein LOC116297117 [Actinia tenebrosa]